MELRRASAVAPWLLLVLGLPAAIALARLSSAPEPPPPRSEEEVPRAPLGPLASLSGEVRDPAGEAAAGAAVEAHAVQGSRVRLAARATADALGRFAFEGLPVGFVALVARGEGLSSGPLLVDLEVGGLGEVELDLGPVAPLAGRVVDEVERPVEGARLCAAPLDPGPVPELEARCATSDEAGAFRIDLDAAGPARLVVTGERIARAERPEVLAPDEEMAVEVRGIGGLRGRVRDGAGAPAEGAEVTLAGSGIWPPRSTRADGDGAYRFDGLPAGVYEVQARRGDLAAPPELGVEVAAGREAVVDLDLAPAATLSGRVLAARDDAPLVGATVTVAASELSAAPVVARTDEAGRFVVRGLLPGSCFVTVWAEGHVPEVGRPCAAPGEVEIRLAVGAVVRGRVVDGRGFPLEGALVEPDLPARSAPALSAGVVAAPDDWDDLGVMPGLELVEPDALRAPPGPPLAGAARDVAARPGLAQTGPALAEGAAEVATSPPFAPEALGAPSSPSAWPVTTGRDGTFEIVGLPATTLRLLARHPGAAPGESEPLTLAPGETLEGVEIRLEEGVALVGRVVDERGFPVEGALLTLQREAGPDRGVAVSREDGTFEMPPAFGTATLTAERSGSVPVTLEVELGAGGGRTAVEVVLVSADRRLAGRVVDERGFPVSGAAVTVRAATGGSPIVRDGWSGEDGSFEVDGLAAGAAVVEVTAPGFATGRAAVGPGEEEVRVVLARAAGLRVEAVDRDTGEPVEACRLVALAAAGGAASAECEGGAALLEGLPGGPLALRVTSEGYADLELSAEAEAGVDADDPRATVRAELAAGAVVHGTVADDSGEPVRGARVSLSPLPRHVAVGAHGPWVETDEAGRFELPGLSRAEGGEVHAALGGAEATAAIGPLWPSDEPEVDLVLEAPRRTRHTGVALDLAARGGAVVVAAVCPGSRAEAAGIRPGDLLTSIDGAPPPSAVAASRALRGPPGTAVLLALVRDGEPRTVLLDREAVEE